MRMQNNNLGMAHTCNPSTKESKSGDCFEFEASLIYIVSKASLGYMKPSLEKTKTSKCKTCYLEIVRLNDLFLDWQDGLISQSTFHISLGTWKERRELTLRSCLLIPHFLAHAPPPYP